MSFSLNDNELQKLVDGELDLASTRKLLNSIDTESDQWRRIATAFVEDRLWQKSFLQLEANSDSANINPPKPETAAKAIPEQSSTSAGFPSWLALAAGLLLAAGVGFYAGSDRSFNDEAGRLDLADNVAATSVTTNSDAGWFPDAALADLTPEYELELTDALGVGKSSVPIYSARRLKQLPASQRKALVASGPSEQELQRWQKSGYQYRQNVDYLSGQLKDGRTFVVPVQTINVSTGQ